MHKKIIFIGDLYRGNQASNIVRVSRLFSPVLSQYGVLHTTYVSEINRCIEERDWFDGWKKSLHEPMPSELKNIDLKNTAVIGFEMSKVDICYLNQENIPWINLAIHPVRFLDDLYFDVKSSFDYQYSLLGADSGVIEFCVNSLRNRYAGYNENENKPTRLAIFGQFPTDKSVFFNGNFHSLDSYFHELDALASEHQEVIYRPHPYATKADIDDLIFKRYNAIDGSSRNVYELLASGDISTACAISSSVISESQYFGIRSVFLDSRAQKFGPAVSYKKLVDESQFWQELLDINSSSKVNEISVVVPNNYLRQVFASWGYQTREDEYILNYQSSAKMASDAVELSKHILSDSQQMQQEFDNKYAQIESLFEQTKGRVNTLEWKAEQIQFKYEQVDSKVEQVESKVEQVESKVEQVDSKVKLMASHSDLILDWIQHREAELKQQLYLAEKRADEQIQRAITAEQQADYWHQEANKWHTRILELHSSTSWVITKPLRLFKRILKFDLSYFRGFSLVLKIKRAVHRFVIYFAPFVLKHPKLKRKLRTILARYPRIYHKIQTIAVKAGLFAQHFEKNNSSPYSFVFDASLCDSLTPDALDIYKKLQIAINNKNKEC